MSERTRTIITLDAADIAGARFHCDHGKQHASYDIPLPTRITCYIDGTPDDLRAAANQLLYLAAEADIRNQS